MMFSGVYQEITRGSYGSLGGSGRVRPLTLGVFGKFPSFGGLRDFSKVSEDIKRTSRGGIEAWDTFSGIFRKVLGLL